MMGSDLDYFSKLFSFDSFKGPSSRLRDHHQVKPDDDPGSMLRQFLACTIESGKLLFRSTD
jgi:hypothetical protein